MPFFFFFLAWWYAPCSPFCVDFLTLQLCTYCSHPTAVLLLVAGLLKMISVVSLKTSRLTGPLTYSYHFPPQIFQSDLSYSFCSKQFYFVACLRPVVANYYIPAVFNQVSLQIFSYTMFFNPHVTNLILPYLFSSSFFPPGRWYPGRISSPCLCCIVAFPIQSSIAPFTDEMILLPNESGTAVIFTCYQCFNVSHPIPDTRTSCTVQLASVV